jgi:hypothetical protein
LHALCVLLPTVWFCWLQLTAGLPDDTLPGHAHDGLQQSQKRVVKPGVPVVGGVHVAPPELEDEPELLDPEPCPPELDDPPLASRGPPELPAPESRAPELAPLAPPDDPLLEAAPPPDDPLDDPGPDEERPPELDPPEDDGWLTAWPSAAAASSVKLCVELPQARTAARDPTLAPTETCVMVFREARDIAGESPAGSVAARRNRGRPTKAKSRSLASIVHRAVEGGGFVTRTRPATSQERLDARSTRHPS